MNNLKLFSTIALSLIASAALAGVPLTIPIEGRLTDSGGTPVTGAAVTFKVEINAPNGCLLYGETKTLNMTGTDGRFSFVLNGTAPSLVANSQPFADIWTNTYMGTGLTGCGGTYNASPSDTRMVSISFDDGGGYEAFPSYAVTAVPYAIEAGKIGGLAASDLVHINTVTSALNQANLDDVFHPTKLGKLQSLLNATAPSTGQVLSWSGSAWSPVDPVASVPTYAKSALPACAAGEFLKNDGSGNLVCSTPAGGGSVSSVATGTGLSGGPITSTGTISIAAGGVSATELAANAVTSAKILDGTISGTDLSASTAINTTGNITGNWITGNTMSIANGGVNKIDFTNTFGANYTVNLPMSSPANGTVLTHTSGGQLSWATPGGGSGDFLKNGTLAMTGSFKAVDGTIALPSITFDSDTDTGVSKSALNQLSVSTSGIERIRVLSNGDIGFEQGLSLGSIAGPDNGYLSVKSPTDFGQVFGDVSISNSSVGHTNGANLQLYKDRSGGSLVVNDPVGTLKFAGNATGTTKTIADIVATITNVGGATAAGSLTLRTMSNGGTVPTPRLRIEPTGNVFIGELPNGANALAPMHISASNTGVSAYVDNSFNSPAGASMIFRSARGTASTPTATQNGDRIMSVGAKGYGSGSHVMGAAIEAFADQAFNGSSAGSSLLFSVAPLNSITPVAAMRIDNSGRVGIGTTTPAARLQVNGDIVGGHFDNSSVTNIYFATGNTQVTSAATSSTITLYDLKPGGIYALVLTTGTTGSFTLAAAGATFYGGTITKTQTSPVLVQIHVINDGSLKVFTTTTIY